MRFYIDDNSPAGYDSGDTHIAEFEYDALGRRIEMVAYNNNGTPTSTTTRYYYDDQRVLLETDWDSSGPTETDVRYFVYGNYIDEVLMMAGVDSGNSVTDGDYYYAHDHLYSAAALFDASGSVVERYEYDAYGEVKILTSGYGLLASSQYGNPYTFTGRRLDVLDGGDLKIMYYRNRYYHPEMGRFMTHDPFGIRPSYENENFINSAQYFQYLMGINVYGYVMNNPHNMLDSSGHGIGAIIDCAKCAYHMRRVSKECAGKAYHACDDLDLCDSSTEEWEDCLRNARTKCFVDAISGLEPCIKCATSGY